MGAFHAATIASSSAADLAFVADPQSARAEELALRLECEATADWEAAMAAGRVDGVVIATPTSSHLHVLERAAERGVDVFCEKPLAPTLGDCLRAIEIAKEHEIALQVGFHRRFDPDWRQLREACESGGLGRLLMLKATLRDMVEPPLTYVESSGGYFADAFIHDFDAARWIGGEVETVTAVGIAATDRYSSLNDFDNAAVIVEFSSGALGLFDGSRLGGYGYDCHAEAVGTRATLRLTNPASSSVRRLEGGAEAAPFPTSFLDRFADAYEAEMCAFASAVATNREPEVGGYDALMAQAIARAADISARRGETVSLSEVLENEGSRVPRKDHG